MKMAACLHLAAFCASLLLFGPAVSAAVKQSLFYNTGRDNYLFKNDVLFDGVVSWSPLGCALLCSSDDRCRAFTRIPGSSGPGSCRGHSVTMTSASTDVTPASGARTYYLAGTFETGACIAGSYTVIDDINRDVRAGKGVICDDSLKDGWYRFLLGGADAVMPSACVPPQNCSTGASFWLDLQGGSLPEEGQETTARGCGSSVQDCCAYGVPVIVVRRCSSFLIYRLTATPACSMAYCAQLQAP